MLIRGLCLQLAFALAVIAQDKASLRVDEILKQWNKPESPGAAVAVIRNGELVFQKGYGTANLEYGIPITPQTVFHVASVSKQFTAMALVLLEADGKFRSRTTFISTCPNCLTTASRLLSATSCNIPVAFGTSGKLSRSQAGVSTT
jgi:hypothetical protein